MAEEGIVHIKNTQSNQMNISQHVAYAFYRKYSDVTPFVIINIFISNCNLITHFFSVDYSCMYFVINTVYELLIQVYMKQGFML